MFLYNLPNSKNSILPNIKYLWFLLRLLLNFLELSDDKKSSKSLSKRDIISYEVAIIAIILTVPSLNWICNCHG